MTPNPANRTYVAMLAILCLTGCTAPTVSVGIQNVAAFANYRADESTASGYLFLAWPLPAGGLFHVQPIFSFDGRTRLLGVGVDWPIPFKQSR